MPLKSIQRTATVAWSPANPNDPLLATGTVAGALDDSFSNTTELEIFRLGLDNKDTTELSKPIGVVSSNARFNRLSWGGATADRPLGVIAGGLENGELMLWNPDAIINGNTEGAELFRSNNHSGAVCGLDFNPFQNNLLASAGGNGEIFVWDLANLSKPYSPGPRSSKLEDITCLAWNRQVQHIMATSSGTGYTVVWDLKNRREVLHLNYGGATSGGGATGLGRRGVTAVAWNPDGATQLVTASEDDGNPVILTWDLRNARAPEKILRGHSMGILGLSWCRMDSNLLLSAGKDNRVLCWNPRDGEIVGELPPSNNWAFDVQWCPRNPNLLSVASFDGKVDVYSVQSDQAVSASQASAVAAIGTNVDDPFNLSASVSSGATALTLKTPPKWLRRPVGATFATAPTAAPGAPNAAVATTPRATVTLRKAVTEPTLVSRSHELEQAIESKSLHAYCEARQKEAAGNAEEEAAWKIIAVLFDGDARDRLVKILGRDRDHVLPELKSKLEQTLPPTTVATEQVAVDDNTPSETPAASTETAPVSGAGGDALSGYFPESATAESDFFSGTSETAATEETGTTDITAAITSTATSTTNNAAAATFHILPADASLVDTLVTRAVQLGDFDTAVRACLDADRLADALLLAVCGGNELLARTRQAYFERRANATPYLRLLRSVIGGNLADVASQGDLAQWDEILVVLCTYARGEEFSGLCAQLGDRLVAQWHAQNNCQARQNAVLCYLAAGDLAKVAQLWIATESEVEERGLAVGNLSASSVHALALQSLMEKVAVLRQAIDHVDDAVEAPLDSRTDTAITNSNDAKFKLSALYDRYCEYAELLASQGELNTAAYYASRTPADYQVKQEGGVDALAIIKDRLRQCGQEVNSITRPFEVTPIGKAEAPAPAPVATTATTNATTYGNAGYGTTGYGTTGYNATSYSTTTTAQTGYGGYGTSAATTATTGYGNTTGYGYNTNTGYDQSYGGAQTTNYGYGSTQAHQAQQPTMPSIPAPMTATMTAAGAGTAAGAYGGYTPANNYGGVPPAPPATDSTARNDIPGWNDPPPMAASTKRNNAVYGMTPLTTPFPGASVTQPNMPSSSGAAVPPPPQNATAPGSLYSRAPNQLAQAPPQNPYGSANVSAPPTQQQQQQQQPMGGPYGGAMGYGGVQQPSHMQQASPPVPAAAPTPPVKQRHPMGDRSHIPANYLPIADILTAQYVKLEQMSPPNQKRYVDDMKKRLDMLIDALNNEEVASPIADQLLQVVQAMEAQNFAGAREIMQDLFTKSGGGVWMVGVRRLVDTMAVFMASRVSVMIKQY
ncbi:hypothetical protein BDF19DRAFT_456694 [Syncephalis fuscata]|nr:hypothetical protein BDF19DRAFT_456694 [Syncephalis fuscata]